MCVCQKIVWSIEFNPALRESPTKTVRASRERGERERWQRQRREGKSEQEREREREQRERQTERERERATREQREQRRRRERRAEPILSCVLYVSLVRAIQLPTLFLTTFRRCLSHSAPLSAPLQLCNTWLERKLIEQKCVTKVSVSVTCPGGLAW